MLLAEDQKKPDARIGFLKQGMFVISKIDVLSKVKAHYNIDHNDKQVFHEFDKLQLDDGSIASYDLFKLHKGADEEFNIIATDAEMKYCNDNMISIKKMRERGKAKDDELCRSDITDEWAITGRPEVKMPSPHHTNCGVCKISFEDYHLHIVSSEHKQNINIASKMYEIFDTEIEEVKLQAKLKTWKTSPKRVKPQSRLQGCQQPSL